MTPIGPLNRFAADFKARINALFMTGLSLFITEANALEANVVDRHEDIIERHSDINTKQGLVNGALTAATAQANLAIAAASSAVNAPGTSASSTTSQAIGKGPKSITVQANKSIPIGGYISVVDSANPSSNGMDGLTTAYNSTTGQLDFIALRYRGSGSIASWLVSVVGAPAMNDFEQNTATTIWPNFGMFGGNFRLDNVVTLIAAGQVALTANATNYIEVSAAGYSLNTTGFTAARFPLYKVVTGASSITSILDARGTAIGFSNVPVMGKATRTSNTQLVSGDAGKYITASGTFTQTFDAVANLGTVWFVWYANNGSGDITVASSDGISNWIMYPGAVRLFQCDGTNLTSIALKGGVKTFLSSANHILAPGIATLFVQALGAGSGGASGYNTAGANGPGGGGGGGGEYLETWLRGLTAGTSTAVTIGAGGAGGPARTSSNSPAPGSNGGNTSFGSLVKAFGGTGATSSGPGIGGGLVVGSNKPTNALWMTGQGTLSQVNDVGTEAAGGFGGAAANSAGAPGYRSLRGGPGGGAGGAIDGSMNPYAGGIGGASGRLVAALSTITGGGGTAGAIGANGGSGGQPVDSLAGNAGGGGGAVVSGTAGAGGAGGLGAGGGGGGAVSTGSSGVGGAGGAGVCVVTEVI